MARKNKETRTDALIRRAKDHPILAWVILGVPVIAVILGLIVQADSVRKVFWPTPEKPTTAPASISPPAPAPSRPANEPSDTAPAPTPGKKGPEPGKTSPPKSIASTNDDRVFVECRYGLMPVATAEEPARVLLTSELAANLGGGGLANFWGDLRKAGGDKGPAWGYRCEINNYTKSTLFNVSVSPRLTFRESVPVPDNEKSRGQGKITLDREWPFTIPKIDLAPAPPFVFYVWNCCVQKFVQVKLPPYVVAEGGRKIPVGQAEENMFQPLMPVPFN